MNVEKRLVVAKYLEPNHKTNWVDLVFDSGVEVFMYDKSENTIGNPHNTHVKEFLPNIGRESHTYLYHIVKNYHNLKDIEIFSQADISDHVPNLVQIINDTNSSSFQFQEFPSRKKIICFNDSSYIKASSLNPADNFHDRGSSAFVFEASPGHKKIYELVYGEISTFEDFCFREFSCHAIFAVSKETIRKIPLHVYEKLLLLFDNSQDSFSTYSSISEYWAYEFEYMWNVIFCGPFKN